MLRILGEDAGIVVSLAGKVTPDHILEALSRKLQSWCMGQAPEIVPLSEQLLELIADARCPWRDRLLFIADHILPTVPIFLFLDNFEDNQAVNQIATSGHISDPELAAFIGAWLRLSSRARLLVTCRHRLHLPKDGNHWLSDYHLGPLSFAEARKLVWRLPALDDLPPARLKEVVAGVGGHPRALEYLDALLRGGAARLPDVDARIRDTLRNRTEISNPDEWLRSYTGNLDRALAETVTLAVDDVLLDALLSALDNIPLARRLLLGASIFRVPVDDLGVAWQISEESDFRPTAFPHSEAATVLRAERARLALTEEAVAQHEPIDYCSDQMRSSPLPPITIPREFQAARDALVELGLLAPVEHSGDEAGTGLLVHRWTAAALQRAANIGDVQEAHHRAAMYWRWRLARRRLIVPALREIDVRDIIWQLEEAYHLLQAGQLDNAAWATDIATSQLDTRGSFSWAEQACNELLEKIDAETHAGAIVLARIGVLAARHADYNAAERSLRQSLSIRLSLNEKLGLASNYGNIATLLLLFGNYSGAIELYTQALAVFSDLDDPTALATVCNNLGNLCRRSGDFVGADTFYMLSLHAITAYRNPLEIARAARETLRTGPRVVSPRSLLEQGTDPIVLSDSLGRVTVPTKVPPLGVILRLRGEYPAAEQRYLDPFVTHVELLDRMALASTQNNLAIMAQLRGKYEAARRHYDVALRVYSENRDRGRVPIVLHNLGTLAQVMGDFSLADDRYNLALFTFAEIDDLAGFSTGYHNLGTLAQMVGEYAVAEDRYRVALNYYAKLNDPIGLAGIHANLAGLDHLQKRFDQAERHYLESYSLLANRGDIPSAATVGSNIGALWTARGKVSEAVAWSLRSLADRLRLSLPESSTDLYWLCRQREALGGRRFLDEVRRVLPKDDISRFLHALGASADAD